jgi:hypothetical protein
MPNLNTPLEVYKILPQTNCRKCLFPSCLAFAAAYIKNEKKLQDCPCLDPKFLKTCPDEKNSTRASIENEQKKRLIQLQKKIGEINFSLRAKPLGAMIKNNTLAITCLGKFFFISSQGKISSECHINPWLTVPILDYIINCQGVEPSGEWVAFRELPSGQTWLPLFLQRCEKPLKDVVDKHTDLFEYIVELFKGKATAPEFKSDISIILSPLPNLPILFCYWRPEDSMESMLNIFFDQSAENNLSIESIFMLLTGMVRMFEKISYTHG